MERHVAAQVFQCEVCQWVWQDEYEFPMVVEAWLARAKGNLICPHCGLRPRSGGRGPQILLLLGAKHEAGLKVIKARQAVH